MIEYSVKIPHIRDGAVSVWHQFSICAREDRALLFEVVRRFAYINRPDFSGTPEDWQTFVQCYAAKLAAGSFTPPLSALVARRTANKIAGWSWNRFAPEERERFLRERDAAEFTAYAALPAASGPALVAPAGDGG